MPPLELVVYEGGQALQRVELRPGMTIGRRKECDVHVPNETVSGRHAQIHDQGGSLVVEDLGSQNKTIVQGGPTLSKGERHPIAAGSSLLLGKIRIALEAVGSAGDMGTMVQPAADAGDGATVRDPGGGATMRDPGGEQTMRQAGDDATMAQPRADESQEIPSWRIERPSDPAIPATAPDPGDAVTQRPQAAPPPAAPPPAPPPQAPPAVPQAPPPSAAPAAEPGGFNTINYGESGSDAGLDDLAVTGALEGLNARLVVCSELGRASHPIRRNGFTIGRKGCDVSLNHPALSSKHARIVFESRQKRLLLEDLGSKNYTFLAGELIPREVAREIGPDSHLRFGPIDALFVIDKGYDGEALSPELFETAVELLELDGKITAEQRKKAASSGKHLGEALILAGAVAVKDWVRALDHADVALIARRLPNPEMRKHRVAILVLAVAVVALAVFAVI